MPRHRHDGRSDFISRTDTTFERPLTADFACTPDRNPDRHDGYTWTDVARRPQPAHRADGDLVRGWERRPVGAFGAGILCDTYRWHPHAGDPALAGSGDAVR